MVLFGTHTMFILWNWSRWHLLGPQKSMSFPHQGDLGGKLLPWQHYRQLAVPFWIVERAREIAGRKSRKLERTSGEGSRGEAGKRKRAKSAVPFLPASPPISSLFFSSLQFRSAILRTLSTIQKGTASRLATLQ